MICSLYSMGRNLCASPEEKSQTMKDRQEPHSPSSSAKGLISEDEPLAKRRNQNWTFNTHRCNCGKGKTWKICNSDRMWAFYSVTVRHTLCCSEVGRCLCHGFDGTWILTWTCKYVLVLFQGAQHRGDRACKRHLASRSQNGA